MRYSFFKKIWATSFTKNSSIWIIIAIAIIPLVMVQQIADSMIEGISRRIIETDSAHVRVKMNTGIKASTLSNFTNMLQNESYITFAYKELNGVGILQNKNKKIGVTFRGVTERFFEEQGVNTYLKLVEGSIDLTSNSIIIGSAISNHLQLFVGDTALFLTTNIKGEQRLPKISRAKVTGIVSTGYEELDKSWVFMRSDTLTSVLLSQEQIWNIGIKVDDPFIFRNSLVQKNNSYLYRGDRILSEIKKIVANNGNIYTWFELNRNKFSLFLSTKSLLFIAMLIAVILAVITLSSAIGMRVIDLEIEIATLKAIGANPSKLEQQIVLQGLTNSFIGSMVGCIVGTLLASQVNHIVKIIDISVNSIRKLFGFTNFISILNPEFYLTEIKFRLYPTNLIIIILFVLGLSVFASWIPARNVRNIPSLKLLRRH